MSTNNINQQIHDYLVTKNFEPESLNAMGKPSASPEDADLLSFNYIGESGKDYGTVVIMIGDDNDVTVYSGDNIGKSMEPQDKKSWFDGFLYPLKQMSTKNLKTFGVQDLNKLKYSMKGQAAIKEGLYESWQGHKNISWNGAATEARLLIKHKRVIGEGEARFRYIESLFVETTEGERYKLGFTKLSGGRAMVEHVRQGGKPYDMRGQHITTIVNELNLLSRFKRANQGKIFEAETAQLVTEAERYYETLQHNIKSISTRTGYSKYFETWDPSAITDEDVIIEDLRHMFIEKNIDSRIEEALPLLAKLKQQETTMKEAEIFESWANLIAEGTWALPDTPEKQNELIELLSQEMPVGPDATDITEQLYNIFGDDELFNRLEELAGEDANADGRTIILNRLEELKDDHDVAQVIGQLKQGQPETVEPEAGEELSEENSLMEYIEDRKDYQDVMRLATQYQRNAATLGRLAQEAGEDSREQRAWEYLRTRKYRGPAKEKSNEVNWNEIVRTINPNTLDQEGGLLNAVYKKMKDQGYGQTPETQAILKNVLSDDSATHAKIEAAWKRKMEKSINMGEEMKNDFKLEETDGDVMFKQHEHLARLERLCALARRIGDTEKAERLAKEIKKIHADNPTGSQDKGHLEESAMSEVDLLLQDIARGNMDIHEIYMNPKSNVEKFVAKQIEEKIPTVARENHLDPEDDIDDILNRIQRELEVEYGVDDNMDIEMDENFGDNIGTEAGMESVGGGNFLEDIDRIKGLSGINIIDTANPLAGQYGHSGKMSAVKANTDDMVERIKFLAGAKK